MGFDENDFLTYFFALCLLDRLIDLGTAMIGYQFSQVCFEKMAFKKMLLKISFLKKQYFLQFSDFSFQVTLPTPETSTLNEASEAESKSTVIDPDETKNSDDEADKTIDDNTEDDSAV